MKRRQFLIAPVAGAAVLQQGMKAAQAAPANIQLSIDAAKPGEPINPLIFGGYMEPATTNVWAEMLTDRKFSNPVTDAAPPARSAPAGFMRRFMGEPFRPVGPAGTVEMDTFRPFVGKHSPRVKLDGREPHGIQQSRLRLGRGKSYVGRVYLAGEAGAKVVVRLVWGPGPGDSQAVTIPPLSREYQKFPLAFTSPVDTQEARLEILGTGVGTFHVGTVSLMPADNMQGFHASMIRLFRDAGFKMAKWPGGNFVSGYDWMDGIGDIDKRPPRGRESNDVGLHEFVAFCRLLGAEPDLTINSGFGSAREAAEEVEYCNCPATTRLGKLRADNGHPEPFNIRLWCIGNEMYGPWQLGRMSLNQYWEKHNRIVEAMRKVDPTIKVCLSGATICERSIGAAEKKGDFFPSEWEPPIPDKLPWELGSHEDWTGWLLANCKGNVDFVSEHTYSYPRLAYDAQKQSFVNRAEDPLPIQARRTSNRIGEAMEVWQEYVKKMPWLKEQRVKFIFDEWGCRHNQMDANLRNAVGAPRPPAMLTPLCYALLMNEMFRHSDMIEASCATGSFRTVLVDDTNEAVGFSAEGLVIKIMQTHFGGAMPVQVGGNSPQQAVPGTPWVDVPKVPIGSPTYPLDAFAALSADRKILVLSVVNPTESAQEFSPRISGVKLRGPGKLWQIAPPSLNSANEAGSKPVVEIREYPQTALGSTVKVPPISINVYEFEIA
ncbi:MAG: alpha-N-arabinofuranosidase [Bryobacteraceae bacterium]